MHVDARALEVGADGAHAIRDAARFAFGGVLCERDRPVVEMADMSGADLVGAQKGQAAHDAAWSDDPGHGILHSEAILDDQDHAVRLENRGDQAGKQVVLRGLERDQDNVARGHILSAAAGVDAGQNEVALLGFDLQAVKANVGVIGVQQKMHIEPGPLEPRSVKAAQGAGAYDRVASRIGWHVDRGTRISQTSDL